MSEKVRAAVLWLVLTGALAAVGITRHFSLGSWLLTGAVWAWVTYYYRPDAFRD